MISYRRIIKKIVASLAQMLSVIPCRYIVFESLPDYADNTRAVFDEMVRRGINKKYRFIWLCVNPNTVIPVKDVKCVCNRYAQIFYVMRSKCIISCNTFTYSFGNYQKSIYLCHGIPLKSLNGYKAPDGIDYIVGTSEDTNLIQSRELNIDINKFQTLGYPRNDALSKKTHEDVSKLFDVKYDKILVWYPTFRQHGNPNVKAATTHSLPIIYDEEKAKIINEVARRNNMLIVLKPHFSQDTSYITKLKLSNIVFITDHFFVENKITSYEFVGGCDALITDYSSIYFDYLLCDKPIAAIWEDIDEYRKNTGFAIDENFYFKAATKVYNIEDFISFLNNISNNIDHQKNERAEMTKIVHKNIDFHSAERVVDFIETTLLS